MRIYDIVYLTNTPSFYKLNLCEAISRRGVKILIVLYGYGAEAVNTQLEDTQHWDFDFEFINQGDAHKRNKVVTFFRLIRLMRRIRTRKVLYAGWMAPEYNAYAFLSPRSKNAMVCESSILDVSLVGMKGWLKMKIIHRMSAVLPSGMPHQQLFESIGFRGKSFITGGVGIFNKSNRQPKRKKEQLKFIFVGRLVEVKAVDLLIEVFNKNGLPLTIVGDGVLRENLESKANANISFIGFISNDKIGMYYSDHDVFILPSHYEPWGLVVEEALFRGLPVIVSDKVGSGIDMVRNLGTGEIFKSGDVQSLQNAIENVSANYDDYCKAVDAIDWEKRDNDQVEAYIKLLNS